MNEVPRKILVVGATGGSGRATVEALLAAGHEVTAFSRHADQLQGMTGRLKTVNGDATNPGDVDAVVVGQDAVIVTLGISENPLSVRLFGRFGGTSTPLDVRSTGTRNVVSAMKRHGVRKLIVQSSYGTGETRDKLRLVDRALFEVLLKPQIRDTELQEGVVRESELDWVLAQPVHLTDRSTEDPPFTSLDGETRRMDVSRSQVARFLAAAAQTPEYIGRSVALSG